MPVEKTKETITEADRLNWVFAHGLEWDRSSKGGFYIRWWSDSQHHVAYSDRHARSSDQGPFAYRTALRECIDNAILGKFESYA